MTPLQKFILLPALLALVTGCEDDMTYPGPQRNYQRYPIAEMTVIIPVPLDSEFKTTFTKTTSCVGNTEVYWDWFYWLGLDADDPYYVLEMEGAGEIAVIGNYNIRLSSEWTKNNYGFTRARMTFESGGYIDLAFDDNKYEFTPEYPYDQTIIEKVFKVTNGNGTYNLSKGWGEITIIMDDPDSNEITLILTGTLELYITR